MPTLIDYSPPDRAQAVSWLPETRPLTVRDGTLVPTRPIRPGDGPALQRFHSRLSEQSIYLRFFRAVPVLTDELAHYYTHLDGMDRYAVIALDPAHSEEIIGVARYDRDPGTDRAEYAIVIADRWQGCGLGLGLTRRLVVTARHRGVRHLYAYVLPENRHMLQLFQRLGLPLRYAWEEDVIHVELDLPTPRGAPATAK